MAAAAGFVYATCVNMVGKWYPERKGGKTGFVNGGFAYGSVPFIFLFTTYMDVANYQGILLAVGVFLAAVVAVSGFFFNDPPKNWWPPHVDPLKVNEDPKIRRALRKNPPAVKQYTPMEAIKTGILPLMWFVLLCTAGINIFGIAMQVPFGKEMGFAGGIVALAMSLKAIVNGTGRGVIGWISDRFGRRDTLIIVCVVLGLAQFAVYFSGSIGSMPLFLLASMVSGFGGGAIFPLFAAMTADYFGENNNATNYGLVYSSKVVSGLVGAGLGAVVVDTWGYGAAFVIAGSVGIACAFLSRSAAPAQAEASQRAAQPTDRRRIEDEGTRGRLIVGFEHTAPRVRSTSCSGLCPHPGRFGAGMSHMISNDVDDVCASQFIAYESLYSVVRRQQPGRRNARCHFPPRVHVSAARLRDITCWPTRAARRVQRPAPLRQAVYDAIVDLIVQGTLQRGQHLVENELAEYLGVSRQPVREALQRLADRRLDRPAPRAGRVRAHPLRGRGRPASRRSHGPGDVLGPARRRERHPRGRQPAVGVAAGRAECTGRQRL